MTPPAVAVKAIDLSDLMTEASRVLPPDHPVLIQLRSLPRVVSETEYKLLARSWIAVLGEERRRERTGGPS